MNLEQCLDILGPIRLHRMPNGHLTLDQRYASVGQIVAAAKKRLQQQWAKAALAKRDGKL